MSRRKSSGTPAGMWILDGAPRPVMKTTWPPPTYLIACPECDGRRVIETGCGGGCGSLGHCFTSPCGLCDGSGTVRKLCDTDGCNHGDCDAARRERDRMEDAEDTHSNR